MRNEFIRFVERREALRVARAEGRPQHKWTKDDILANYRFCNVHREHDSVTRWVREHVQPSDLKTAIVQFFIARIFNEPEVLDEVLPFRNSATAVPILKARRKRGEKILRGAYMVAPHGPHGKGHNPEEYFCRAADELMAKPLDPNTDTLEAVADWMLDGVRGIGPFFANQVCTDLRYWHHCNPRKKFKDWKTFVLAGPGTSRGLNRYHGREVRKSVSSEQKTAELLAIRDDIRDDLSPSIAEYFLDINDLSNCFCEFDKYCRAKDQQMMGERVTLRKFSPTTK